MRSRRVIAAIDDAERMMLWAPCVAVRMANRGHNCLELVLACEAGARQWVHPPREITPRQRARRLAARRQARLSRRGNR